MALLLLACMGLQLSAMAQLETVRAPLSAERVVQNLVRMNAERAQAMCSYQGKRIYRLEYHGFAGTRNAEMVVDVKYQAPGTKEFIYLDVRCSILVLLVQKEGFFAGCHRKVFPIYPDSSGIEELVLPSGLDRKNGYIELAET